MEDIEFCKYEMLDMLHELNKYAIDNDVKEVSINHLTYINSIAFTHIHKSYSYDNKTIYISTDYDTHKSAYEKYERMMKCMKEGALLVD